MPTQVIQTIQALEAEDDNLKRNINHVTINKADVNAVTFQLECNGIPYNNRENNEKIEYCYL